MENNSEWDILIFRLLYIVILFFHQHVISRWKNIPHRKNWPGLHLRWSGALSEREARAVGAGGPAGHGSLRPGKWHEVRQESRGFSMVLYAFIGFLWNFDVDFEGRFRRLADFKTAFLHQNATWSNEEGIWINHHFRPETTLGFWDVLGEHAPQAMVQRISSEHGGRCRLDRYTWIHLAEKMTSSHRDVSRIMISGRTLRASMPKMFFFLLASCIAGSPGKRTICLAVCQVSEIYVLLFVHHSACIFGSAQWYDRSPAMPFQDQETSTIHRHFWEEGVLVFSHLVYPMMNHPNDF